LKTPDELREILENAKEEKMSSIFLDRYDNDLLTKVYSPDDLAKIVRDSTLYYVREAERAFKSAAKTREEVKSETLNEYERENEQLKKKLRFSVARLGSDSELEMYKQFCDEHKKCMSGDRANWGKAPYVKQYGTGMGTCTEVYCQVCGAHKDITDMSNW